MVGAETGVRGGTPASRDGVDRTSDDVRAGTRRPLTGASVLEPAAWTSDEFFEIERRRVFEHAWVLVGVGVGVGVGVAGDVASRGRVIVRQIGRRSVPVTRDEAEQLRGFPNSCRHRGTELIETDCDVRNTIRCPYQRWGDRLDGALRSTP